MRDYEAKYEMLFTNFFRFSYVTLLALALEDWLAKLCRAVQIVKKLPDPPPKSDGRIVARFRSYITKAGVDPSDELWEAALDIYSVRNCVVHYSGKVPRSRPNDRKRIESLASGNRGIRVSGIHKDNEAIPLYLEDGMMIIDAEYCKYATEEVKALLTQLCDAVPLNRLAFK